MLRTRSLSLMVLGLALVGACGEADEREGTQPTPDVTTFENGRFDDLPLVPDSEPFGPRHEEDGIVTRSFRTTGDTAQDVLDFFERALPAQGWTMVEPRFREDTLSRADWVVDGWRLEVSAKDIETESSEPVAQYSMVLRPR